MATKTLCDMKIITINGQQRVLGRCVMCGRNVTRSMLNKTGARCAYEGAQYDNAGVLRYDASGHWHDEDTVMKIAKRFSAGLRHEIGAEKLGQAISRNRKEKDSGTCHSHNFCDANVVMDEACKCVIGKGLATFHKVFDICPPREKN